MLDAKAHALSAAAERALSWAPWLSHGLWVALVTALFMDLAVRRHRKISLIRQVTGTR